MTESTLTRSQQQTQKARESFAARFPTPEARTEHYRELGRKSAEGRVVLRVEEFDALVRAHALIDPIIERLAPHRQEAANDRA